MQQIRKAFKWVLKHVECFENLPLVQRLTVGRRVYTTLAALAVITLVVTSVFIKSFYCEGPLEEDKMLTIEQGMGAISIVAHLQKQGVIAEGSFTTLRFRAAALLAGATNTLKSGTYTFPKGASIKDVLNLLEEGKVTYFYVTIPEGFTAEETSKRLAALKQLKQQEVTIKEGSILPETYAYEQGESTAAVVERMRAAMQKVVDEAWQSRAIDLPVKNKEELIILASMVEKETSLPEEYGEVAAVFVNRLRKGMRLQSDPTVIYGASNYHGNIQRKHLKEPHKYNTYVHKGLPIGAIANPGAGAIWAAAHPNTSDKFYFVATGFGGHIFAKTFKEHQKNVQEYLKNYRKNTQNK